MVQHRQTGQSGGRLGIGQAAGTQGNVDLLSAFHRPADQGGEFRPAPRYPATRPEWPDLIHRLNTT